MIVILILNPRQIIYQFTPFFLEISVLYGNYAPNKQLAKVL